jgi:hypothetical protein
MASLTAASASKPPVRRRALIGAAVAAYSIAVFLALDFGYSTFINSEASPRIPVAEYNHGLAAKFDGYTRFGEYRYRFITNSLGMRDGTTRDVPLTAAGRRILLIGDSFTEGMMVPFEQSFAGLLYRAGQDRPQPVEFLNAAVVSYSPIIYYLKTQHLLDSGLKFDEVVVFSDISDVEDEATSYFCLDNPNQRKDCVNTAPPMGTWLAKHFIVTDTTRLLIKYRMQMLWGNQVDRARAHNPRAGWTLPGYDLEDEYAPLGVEGGIARSLKDMQALADMLKARGIPLTIVVYPWPLQLAENDRNSRQAAIWRDFCVRNCKAFIDLFPAFFAERDAHADWYKRLFFYGDAHFSAAGNALVFREVAERLLP